MDERAERERIDGCRWTQSGEGHYESWFCRANDPSGRRAFWIRYTIFEPRGRPDDAVGELWAIAFERDRAIVAVKQAWPHRECSFSRERLDVRIGEAALDDAMLRGSARSGEHTIAWDLAMSGGQRPLLLLPERLYEARLPRAKALVGRPLARFSGTLTIDGSTTIEIDDWVGSQNHNWGSRHTDHYAWGQVAGFDEDPDAFLECSTARLRLGPVWTPFLSPLVLRVDGREHAFNALGRTLRASGRFSYFDWRIETRDRDAHVDVHVSAATEGFVALRYDNPPGGTKTCLNSKLAHCEVHLHRRGEAPRRLTSSRAAFEILTDDDSHGLRPVV